MEVRALHAVSQTQRHHVQAHRDAALFLPSPNYFLPTHLLTPLFLIYSSMTRIQHTMALHHRLHPHPSLPQNHPNLAVLDLLAKDLSTP